LTFHDYITRERMETARQLLCGKGWSVDLVCRFVGLKPTQLRSQFKLHFGVTPSQFRKDGQNR
jgi:AraC-like DNA-binding protein